MVNEVGPAASPVAGLVHGSPTPPVTRAQDASGNNLPHPRQAAAIPAAAHRAAVPTEAIKPAPDLESLVGALNKYLNESGQPYRYRIASQSGKQTIQEVNPANGEVVGEYPASEFPALAASAGLSRALFNGHA